MNNTPKPVLPDCDSFTKNPYPFIRVRLFPNNQLCITQTSKRPTEPKKTDTEAQKRAARVARLVDQILSVASHLDLCEMIGYSCVELPVACYRLPGESESSVLTRADFLSKDDRYKPYLPYKSSDDVHNADLWESPYQQERRQRRRAAEKGVAFYAVDPTDRQRIPWKRQLVARNGYYWDNIIVRKEDLLPLQARLKAILSSGLDLPAEIQESTEKSPTESGRQKLNPQSSSDTLGADYPATEFGHGAKRKMNCAGHIMDKLCTSPDDIPNAVFVTLTLPGSTDLAVRTLAAWSGYIQNRLMQVIRDYEKMFGFSIYWLRCWEWQKRGALHLHLVLGSDCSVEHSLLLACSHDIKNLWHKLLLSFYSDSVPRKKLKLGNRSGSMPVVDLYERAEKKEGSPSTWRESPHKWQDKIESVRKSVGRYLSKYTGKDKRLLGKKPDKCYYPSRWWGCSRELSQLVTEQTLDVRLELVDLCDTAFSNFVDAVRTDLALTNPRVTAFVVLHSGKTIKLNKKTSPRDESILRSINEYGCLLSGMCLNAFTTVDIESAQYLLVSRLKTLRKSILYAREFSKTYIFGTQ